MPETVHAINWFEIPVTDFARAKAFYEAVLDTTIESIDMGPMTMGFLPSSQDGVGGALVQGEGNNPTHDGSRIYLNVGVDLAPGLARVEAAGGKIVLPKTEIGNDFGFYALFEDTEGNLLGFHSMR